MDIPRIFPKLVTEKYFEPYNHQGVESSTFQPNGNTINGTFITFLGTVAQYTVTLPDDINSLKIECRIGGYNCVEFVFITDQGALGISTLCTVTNLHPNATVTVDPSWMPTPLNSDESFVDTVQRLMSTEYGLPQDIVSGGERTSPSPSTNRCAALPL